MLWRRGEDRVSDEYERHGVGWKGQCWVGEFADVLNERLGLGEIQVSSNHLEKHVICVGVLTFFRWLKNDLVSR